MARFNVNRYAKTRAVEWLEEAKLISVKPRKGRKNPIVTILNGQIADGLYLGAKIPLKWLGLACSFSGKTLATALAIWFVVGLRKGDTKGLYLTADTLKLFH